MRQQQRSSFLKTLKALFWGGKKKPSLGSTSAFQGCWKPFQRSLKYPSHPVKLLFEQLWLQCWSCFAANKICQNKLFLPRKLYSSQLNVRKPKTSLCFKLLLGLLICWKPTPQVKAEPNTRVMATAPKTLGDSLLDIACGGWRIPVLPK